MQRVIGGIVGVVFLSIAQAGGSHYDWQSGNQYSWSPGLGGGTELRGYNAYTGSQWNTTIAPNGDMRGTDSNFNQWNYNSSTGTYINYGTGTICTGTGALRVCN